MILSFLSALICGLMSRIAVKTDVLGETGTIAVTPGAREGSSYKYRKIRIFSKWMVVSYVYIQ